MSETTPDPTPASKNGGPTSLPLTPSEPRTLVDVSEEIPAITAEIIEGLAREGDYGFEMRIGRDLNEVAGARVRHGQSYIDHRTEKEREFDYQFAYFNANRRLQLAVECKNVFRDSPIVVCGQRRVKSESYHDIVCAGQGALRDISPHAILMTGVVSQVFPVANSNLYPVSEPGRNFVGKSIFRPKPPSKEKRLEAKKKNRPLPFDGYTVVGDDDGYSAWNQALGSAADLALRALEFKSAPGEPKFAATVTLPAMIVPDGTLWQVEFNDAGEPLSAPIAVESVTYFCDHRARLVEKIGTAFYRVVRLPHVHFYTQTGLRNFLKIVQNRHAMFWETTFREEPIEDFQMRFSPNS